MRRSVPQLLLLLLFKKSVKTEMLFVPVLIETAVFFFVAVSVMRSAAFGTNNDVIAVLEPVVTYGAGILRKIHIFLHALIQVYYNKF